MKALQPSRPHAGQNAGFKAGTGQPLRRKCHCSGLAPNAAMPGTDPRVPMQLQAGLAMDAGYDPLEREADRVADQVTANSGLAAPTGSAPVRIQRYVGPGPWAGESVPDSVMRTLGQSGTPMAPDLRQDMEARFGHDLSHVRVHHDALAARSAAEVSARAYTVAGHIVFGEGEYDPQSRSGRHLLAHELTHTLQQSAATASAGHAHGSLPLQREPAGKPGAAVKAAPASTTADEATCASEGTKADLQRALCAGEVGVYRKVLNQLKREYAAGTRDKKRVDESLGRLLEKLETWVQDHKMSRAFATWEDASTPKKRCQAALFAARALRARLRAGVPDAVDPEGQAWSDAINTLRNAQGDLAKLICFIKYAEKPLSMPENKGSVFSRCDYVVYQSDDPTLSMVWKGAAHVLQPKNPPIPFGASTEEGFNNVLARARKDDCSCISSIEFWGHGSPGGAFSNRMTGSDLEIPGVDAHGPGIDADQRSAWLASLTGEQQAYVKLRDMLCRPGGSLYYRTCSTFAEQRGARFAEKATRFWQVPVSAHTEDIGLTQPGKRTLRPCEHAYWSLAEKSCDTCGGGKP